MSSKKTASPPATNPDVGKPAQARVTAPNPVDLTTHIKGEDLVPDFERLGQGRVSKRYTYWVGITPSCPVESITLAGINFPKLNEELLPDPMRTGNMKRRPVIGAIVRLTQKHIERIKEQLPRTVIRFRDDKGTREEPGTGENLGDLHERPRRGEVITVPTPETIAARQRAGKALNAYVPRAGDVPAARYLFAFLCADQGKGERLDHYPDVLETTGLGWPDEIEVEIATNEMMG